MGENRMVTHGKITMSLSQWAKKLNVPVHTLRTRAARGYTPHQILFGKQTKHGVWKHLRYLYKGEVRPLKEIALMTGIKYHTLRYRLLTDGKLHLG